MKKESVKIIRSIVEAEDLARLVAENYDLDGPVSCRLRSAGDNDTYIVRAGARRYVLRVWYPRYWVKDPSHYRFEVEWLDFLRGRGLPVSHPIRRRDGELLGAVAAPEGTRYWTLLSWAEGVFAYPMDGAQAFAFGAGIAAIQQASDEFASGHSRFSYDLDFLFVDPIAGVAEFMGEECAEDIAYIAAVGQMAKGRIEALDLPAAAYGIVGGDYHGGNNYFAGAAPTFFDFDVAGYGCKVYDLAVFYHNNLLNGTMGDQWDPILAGYESVRPLRAAERAAVVPLATGRRIWRMGVRAREAAFLGDQDYYDYGKYWEFSMDALRRWEQELAA